MSLDPAGRSACATKTGSSDLPPRVTWPDYAVDREENPLYWKLLHAAGKASGRWCAGIDAMLVGK